ncbi:MAG: hypothetical protein WDO18_16435 [Acidobacteriota bacterium]
MNLELCGNLTLKRKSISLFAALFVTSVGLLPPAAAQAVEPDSIPVKNWSVRQSREMDRELTQSTRSAAGATPGLVFIAITPCRVLDTRLEGGSGKTGAFGPPALVGSQPRIIPVPSSNCGIPVSAAYSMYIVSITPVGQSVGWVSAWQSDRAWPGTVILNAPQGGIIGNSAMVPAGYDGGIQVLSTDATHLVIDVNGYYVQSPVIEGPAGPQGPAGPPGSASSIH